MWQWDMSGYLPRSYLQSAELFAQFPYNVPIIRETCSPLSRRKFCFQPQTRRPSASILLSTPPSLQQALENNPRVASGVQQTGAAFNNVVRQVSDLALQAMDGAKQGATQGPENHTPQAPTPGGDAAASGTTVDESSSAKTI